MPLSYIYVCMLSCIYIYIIRTAVIRICKAIGKSSSILENFYSDFAVQTFVAVYNHALYIYETCTYVIADSDLCILVLHAYIIYGVAKPIYTTESLSYITTYRNTEIHLVFRYRNREIVFIC